MSDYTAGCPFTIEGEGVCNGCGKPLIGRARRWCAGDCSATFWRNHAWTVAREAAKALVITEDGHAYTCAHCGVETPAPEVNHKTPVLGKHSTNGCHHHLDGLEVLCHSCHLKVTREQRAAGMFGALRPAIHQDALDLGVSA